ncbi:MAG: glycosyltransferase family 2 protein [Methylophilaceae bacterium]
MPDQSNIGIVVIGRNEGERLLICLKSALAASAQVIYVDSGSTDGSVAAAMKLGAYVVSLDMSIQFTAARARNAGVEKLVEKYAVEYIQFIDGDCEFYSDWMEKAAQYLTANPKTAVVAGRLRERYPEKSLYNKLCDIEWDTKPGDTKACGGIMMMRREAFKRIGGFNENLIAGEEPELCVRLRQADWKIHRLADDMAKHDANMHHFSQWWKRVQRGGHAFAEGASMHGAPPEKHWVAERNRAWIWAVIIPAIIIAAACFQPWLGLLLLLIYPLQIFRTARQHQHLGSFKWKYASLLVLGKFAEIGGQFQFYKNKLLNKQAKLIEYKT